MDQKNSQFYIGTKHVSSWYTTTGSEELVLRSVIEEKRKMQLKPNSVGLTIYVPAKVEVHHPKPKTIAPKKQTKKKQKV
jgi:hypothetical protein